MAKQSFETSMEVIERLSVSQCKCSCVCVHVYVCVHARMCVNAFMCVVSIYSVYFMLILTCYPIACFTSPVSSIIPRFFPSKHEPN